MRVHTTFLIILILLAAVCVCYEAAPKGDFLWDDEYLIERNPLVRAPLLSFRIFKQDILNSNFTYTVYYRPFQMISYAADYRMWGMNPAAFHIFNVFLHFLNGVLVFLLTRKLVKEEAIAFLTAAIFVIHPVNAGTVLYISSRADLLVFLFGFVFMLMFVRFRETGKYVFFVISQIALIAALLSKEVAVIFPFLMLYVDLLILQKEHPFKWTYHLPGFFIICAGLGLHYMLLGSSYGVIFNRSDLIGSIMIFLGMVKRFITVVFVPTAIQFRHSTGNVSPAGFIVFWGTMLGGLLAVYVYLKRSRKILILSAGFFLIALLPLIFVLQYFSSFGEHWIYLAGYGIFLFISRPKAH